MKIGRMLNISFSSGNFFKEIVLSSASFDEHFQQS